MVMVFNATFNNISVIYRGGEYLLMEGTGGPGENNQLSLVTDKLYHYNVVSKTPPLSRIRTHNFSGDSNRLHRQL